MKKILIFSESISFNHIAKPILFLRELLKLPVEIYVACGKNAVSFFQKEKIKGIIPLRTVDSKKVYGRLVNEDYLYNSDELLSYFKEDTKIIEDLNPDLVVSDFRASALQVAKSKNIPTVSLITVSLHPDFKKPVILPDIVMRKSILPVNVLEFLSKSLVNDLLYPMLENKVISSISLGFKEASSKLGYPVLPSFFHYVSNSDVRIIFDHPDLFDFQSSANDVFFGAPKWDTKEELPKELEISLKKSKQPVIYLAIGTQEALTTHFLEELINALVAKNYRIVLTTGNREFHLVHKSDKVHVYPFLNDARVLKYADFFVHHSGAMTCYQPLFYEVPSLGLPAQVDQHYYAYVMKNHGLMDYIYPSQINISQLVKKIEMGISSVPLRERIAKFGREISAYKPDITKQITRLLGI